MSMTFGVLDSATWTDATVLSVRNSVSDLPEDPAPEWNAATAYTVGAEVHRPGTHRVYSRLTAGTTPTAPESDPTNWKDMRPTNRWAAFDLYRSTQMSGDTQINLTLRPGVFTSSVWLGGTHATSASLTVRDGVGGPVVHATETHTLDSAGRYDWQSFFLAPTLLQSSDFFTNLQLCVDPVLEITLDFPGGVAKLGSVQVGRFVPLATTEYGTGIGRRSFSFRKENPDGTYEWLKRPGAQEIDVKAFVEPSMVRAVDAMLERYDATPALWIAHTEAGYEVLRCFGVFEGKVTYDNYGQCTLTGRIEGII